MAAARAEADADAYTLGQVAHGLTSGGVVTGVDYGHGVVSGVGAIGNRAVYAAAPAVHVAAPAVRTVAHVATPAVHTVATPAVYSGVHSGVYSAGVYSGLPSVYGNHYGHYYGKREAEPYTYGQVYSGLPLANAYAHNVGYTTGYGYTGYPYAHHGYGYSGHFYG